MRDDRLDGRHILVVEDEYFLADELDGALRASGAVVLGPVATVKDALALLEGGAAPDAAVLDVNLGGELASPVADALLAQGVPFLFTTGHDRSALPGPYAGLRWLEKPVESRVVLRELGRLLGAVA